MVGFSRGVIVVVTAQLLVGGFWLFSDAAGRMFEWSVLESTFKIMLWGAGSLPVALWMARGAGMSTARALGFGPVRSRGTVICAAATLPMAAALLLIPFKRGLVPDLALGSDLLGPFAEELLFRGFVFGLLWRVARWPAGLAIATSAALFGFAHRTAEIPMIGGGLVLGWLAYRWDSLWPAVATHACMNLWWDLSSSGAVEPAAMSFAQIISFCFVIVATFVLTRGTRDPMSRWIDGSVGRYADRLADL